MALKLLRALPLTVCLGLSPGCGEDPLGNDDDGDADHSADDHSGDGTPAGGKAKDAATPVAGNDMKGQINGKDWTLVKGSAEINEYDGKVSLTIRLLGNDEKTPCTYDEKRTWFDTGFVKIRQRTGPAASDNSLYGDLYYYDEKTDTDDSEYVYDDEISLEISEQTATKVSGTVKLDANLKNSVAGTFSVEVCP